MASPTSHETAGIPIIFEVLAIENLAQAEDRAGGAHGNKGWEAADAVLSIVSVLEQLRAARIERERAGGGDERDP